MNMEKTIWVYVGTDAQRAYYQNCLSYRYQLVFFDKAEQLIDSISDTTRPDLVIADIPLAQIDVLKKFTMTMKKTQTIVVTELDDFECINYAFELGASEYFVKPLNQNLFLSKVRRVLYPDYRNFAQSAMDKRFDRLGLTVKELKIMKSLLSSPSNKMHRDAIVERIWGSITVHQKTLDVHIYNLRKKLSGSEFSIRSEGSGFFAIDVKHLAMNAAYMT